MSATDHWSIGEVLALLQDEFPEVTISKIRFLESQGLINPERTPSGYRRFQQSDFDRLHWILVQQRDHYLPLKVIRDRLESGEADLDDTDPPIDEPALGEITVDPAGSADPAVGDTAAGEQPADRTATDEEAADGSAADTRAPDTDRAGSEPATDERAVSEKAAAMVAATTNTTERRGAPKMNTDADVNLALTLDELAEASGIDVDTLVELERFDMIHGRQIGPTVLYDGEALLIARLSGQFAAYGLEARHLRTLRIGAEREVGLLTQIVEPAMHRRDAETRRRALDTLDDLVDLAASMRSILVRQMVRAQLPSQRG